MELKNIIRLRHQLHRRAELAGKEEKTAGIIQEFFKSHPPDRLKTGLGGHGIAALFGTKRTGPTIMFRCEMDALPINETTDLPYKSQTKGVSHKCGHDGQMAIIAAVAQYLAAQPIIKGRIVLLFQPAEENGQGARGVLEDPDFLEINPDYIFALHNMPGFEKNSIITRPDTFAAASRGLIVDYQGTSSHASEPQKGSNPAPAVADLIHAFSSLPQYQSEFNAPLQVTLIYTRIGNLAFGISPGTARVAATLRAHSEKAMQSLSRQCVQLAKRIGNTYGLQTETQWTEEFEPTVNDCEAVNKVLSVARKLDLNVIQPEQPFPGSEDFGYFQKFSRIAYFGLGAGEAAPPLHAPDYDFPDELIALGVKIILTLIRDFGCIAEGKHSKEKEKET